jgi:hypothetical protein
MDTQGLQIGAPEAPPISLKVAEASLVPARILPKTVVVTQNPGDGVERVQDSAAHKTGDEAKANRPVLGAGISRYHR